jgi:superfamily II DNA or RNA helicase
VTFEVGSLVRARGREWVVLPESEADLLMLKPLSGRNEEIAGVLPALETIEAASFSMPNPDEPGDYRSARLLREAARLGFRDCAGPFRSFGRISVEPRNYQLVPLLVALKQDPVRVLIADDVGIGKTIEACLIARELLDRGDATRLAVLTPPHLAEQWQEELRDKFNIDAELLLASTVRKLEGACPGESVFHHYPYLVISMDFVKSDRYRFEFIRECPELVIVDEAHGCAFAEERGRGRQQRHELVKGLAEDAERHMILVTATPHSGKADSFRSLLAFLDEEFRQYPDNLAGRENEAKRRKLAQFFVQRRRADIRHFLQEDTPFPEREESELSYQLSSEYRELFDAALSYIRESLGQGESEDHRQRVRWWSALALLRSLASSPRAAAATLRNRSVSDDDQAPSEVDVLGKRLVMDLLDENADSASDAAPAADPGDDDPDSDRLRRKLLAMARTAEQLEGDADAKLQIIAQKVKELIRDGFRPILFCRFIPTAEYVAEHLRSKLRGVEVEAVTGTLPPADRESRIEELAEHDKRVLVATDCLSEGINLQEYFDAVIHYDLAWNPTRHEQREGRADRYGQPSPTVRVLTCYGEDNLIDGRVLDVLIRKHNTIRRALGVSVPVPADSSQVMEVIIRAVIDSGLGPGQQMSLPGLESKRDELHQDWENVSEREKRSRTLFAQETIKAEDVAAEVEALQTAIGRSADVRWFVHEAVQAYGGTAVGDDIVDIDPRELPPVLRDQMPSEKSFSVRYELPITADQVYLNRAHSAVAGLANFVFENALDGGQHAVARRASVIRTRDVTRRTTLLLTRMRFAIRSNKQGRQHESLAEEIRLLAFEGSPNEATWLDNEQALALLDAQPSGNVDQNQARNFLSRVVEAETALRAALDATAVDCAEALLESHLRVRAASRTRGKRPQVEPFLPVDILGVYVYLPVVG